MKVWWINDIKGTMKLMLSKSHNEHGLSFLYNKIIYFYNFKTKNSGKMGNPDSSFWNFTGMEQEIVL